MTAQRSRDLTQGSLSGHLFRLAVPLLFGNILQEFYNTIDAFVVGRFAGQEEFAAIGIAGTMMNLFLFALVGCCTGYSILFAQAYGQNDLPALRRQEFSALLAGLFCTVVLMAVGLCGMRPLLALLQTPAALQPYVTIYLRWIFLSLPAAFLYNLLASLLRATGDTQAALYVLAAAVGANLLLDLLFVAHFSLGIAGAAAATALTQVFSAILCLFYLSRTHGELLLRRESCHLDRPKLFYTFRFGLVSSLHHCSLYLGKTLVQGAVNTAGTEVIAAYTAAARVEGFANSFGSSGSTATSILIAQNYGASRTDRVNAGLRCSAKWLVGLGCLCGVLLYGFAPGAVYLLLGTREGVAFTEAVRYLRFIAVFYPSCFAGNTLTGYFNGKGQVACPFAGTLGHITIRVVLSWTLFSLLGLNAVALGTGLGWLAACVFWVGVKLALDRRQTSISS